MSIKSISQADHAMIVFLAQAFVASGPDPKVEAVFRKHARILFNNLPNPQGVPSNAKIKMFAEKIADLAIDTEDTKLCIKLLQLTKTIRSALKKVSSSITVPALEQTNAQKIDNHNSRAAKSLSPDRPAVPLYPYSKQDKKQAKKQREMIRAFSFSSSDKTPIYSETVKLVGSEVKICAARGHRPTMEDRFLAQTLCFEEDGIVFHANLFGVFDGHHGSNVVDYVVENLPAEITKIFNEKGYSKERIYPHLKEAVANLHETAIEKGLTGGTTAVFGFKMEGSNDLFIANIGDSTAFLNRSGTAIPLSIPQKPELTYTTVLNAPTLTLNKYARELLDNGVKLNVFTDPHLEEETLNGKAMVLSPIFDSKNGSLPLLLGILHKLHMDMARSIGDRPFAKWAKHTPEIFGILLQPGDQLIMHSDGVTMTPGTIVDILSWDKIQRCSTDETLQCLVQASTPNRDNICAMSVTFT